MIKRTDGFTIVEVVVLVVIVAIIVTISVVTYSRVQADSRDTERASKVAIIADALERYHRANGEYPGCVAMTQDGAMVVANVLDGLDPDVLLVPGSPAGVTNSVTCTALSGTTDAYAYIGDGTAACNTGQACRKYTLQYRHETSGTIKTVSSRYDPT